MKQEKVNSSEINMRNEPQIQADKHSEVVQVTTDAECTRITQIIVTATATHNHYAKLNVWFDKEAIRTTNPDW